MEESGLTILRMALSVYLLEHYSLLSPGLLELRPAEQCLYPHSQVIMFATRLRIT